MRSSHQIRITQTIDQSLEPWSDSEFRLLGPPVGVSKRADFPADVHMHIPIPAGLEV